MFKIKANIMSYLKRNFAKLKSHFREEFVVIFLNYYEDVPVLELKESFSLLHYKVNDLFSFMNDRARTNHHFNAYPSRELLFIMDTLKEMQANLKGTKYEFKVDDYYENILSDCRAFLSSGNGSTIPEDFNEISLIENKPIFFLNEAIKIHTPESTSSYSMEEKGQGSYAIVYKYKDKHYDKVFAVKKAKFNLTKQELERFQHEYNELKKLNSPYIIEVYNYDEESNQYIMEYIDKTLEEYIISKSGNLEATEKRNLIFQILKAFQYLHSKNLLHRNISVTNILIKEYDDKIVNIKVSDFGLVKIKDSKLTELGTEVKRSLNDPTLHEVGFSKYREEHEIYALTRLISFILSGRMTIPNYPNNKVVNFIIKGTHPETDQRYSNIEEMTLAFRQIQSEIS